MDNGENQNLPVRQNKSQTILLFLIIAIGSFVIGYNFRKEQPTVFGDIKESVSKNFKTSNQENAPVNVDYNLLWNAINVVNEKYIEKPVDQQKLLFGAVRGAVAATGDPYTDFLEPKDLENFKTDLKGSFDGIGAEVGKREGQIVIVAPLDDSPAKKAGLLAKDIILEVNGKSTQGWSVEEAVREIRGKKGTKVTLNIFREGKIKPFDVVIVRDKIVIKSIKWEVKEKNGKKIAVVTLSRFGDDTKNLFNKAINEILRQSVSGVIVDLRNNPGGYLQTAVDVASAWVEEGKPVVTEEKSQGMPDVFKSEGGSRLKDLPTLVIINGGSASASEILAGALRDYNIAKLLGEKSFGKGSVQELVDLKEGGAVKVTVAKWITPGGKNLNKEGLMPDIEIKMSEEDINAGRDPQMERAMEEIAK